MKAAWLMPLLQFVSLAATGFLLWKFSVGPRLLWQPFRTVAALALLYAALAWVWSAGMLLALYLILPGTRRGQTLVDAVLRTSMVGVWFAPATILLSNFSPAALAAGLALIVTATRLLCSDWLERRQGPGPFVAGTMFGMIEPAHRTWTRELATGIASALAIQFGVTAALANLHLGAAALFALSAAMLTLFAVTTGAMAADRPKPLPQNAFGVVLTILLASGLTIGGIQARKQRGHADDFGTGSGPVASAREILKELFEKGKEEVSSAGEGDRDEGVKPVPIAMPVPADGDFPGVILWPEIRDVPRLVAPMPRGAGREGAFVRPYSIPFGGEYWIYRILFRRPPANSWRHRGSPAALSFSSTDHSPLLMEAHQKLDPPIDLACCREVRVEIWNADRYPGTISLELFSSDSAGQHTASLGKQPVGSSPFLRGADVIAVPETLVFPVPPRTHECGELKVIFTRARSRAEKSARIAIDRFVLAP